MSIEKPIILIASNRVTILVTDGPGLTTGIVALRIQDLDHALVLASDLTADRSLVLRDPKVKAPWRLRDTHALDHRKE